MHTRSVFSRVDISTQIHMLYVGRNSTLHWKYFGFWFHFTTELEETMQFVLYGRFLNYNFIVNSKQHGYLYWLGYYEYI